MSLYTWRSGATSHPEDSVMQPFTDIVKTGGVIDLGASNHFKVTQRGAGANMSVDVAIGRAFVKGTGNAYPARNTTAVNKVIGNNVSGNPRKDSIVLYIDLAQSPDTTASNVLKIAVVPGTPASSPVAPTDGEIQTNIGASNPFLRLADVNVIYNATSIADADITDRRVAIRTVGSSKNVTAITSSASPTPNCDTDDIFEITALAANATFGAPTGTPTDGKPLIIRIKDNGTARTLAFNAIYRAIGCILPTVTTVGKTLYLGCSYNSADSTWDVLSVQQEF